MTHDGRTPIEKSKTYSKGGFHPIDIGDRYECYEIIHKLGFGLWATVWLALNHDFGGIRAPKHRYVAIKVHASRSVAPLKELDSLVETSAYEFTVKQLDTFTITGPNGEHHCTIMPFLGPTLYEWMCFDLPHFRCGLSPTLARKIAAQLVDEVADLHAAGIVHGDLHPQNLSLGTLQMNDWSIEDVYRRLGDVVTHTTLNPPPTREDMVQLLGEEFVFDSESESTPPPPPESEDVLHLPRDRLAYITPIKLAKHCDPASTSKLTVFDFGEAWTGPKDTTPSIPLPPPPRKLPHTPLIFAAPGVHMSYNFPEFRNEITAASEIWNLGCVLASIFSPAGLELFPRGISHASVVTQHVAVFGKLPERWWGKAMEGGSWMGIAEDFDAKDATPIARVAENFRKRTLERRLGRFMTDEFRSKKDVVAVLAEERFEASDEVVLLRMVKALLKLEPGERITAAELKDMVPDEWRLGKPAKLD